MYVFLTFCYLRNSSLLDFFGSNIFFNVYLYVLQVLDALKVMGVGIRLAVTRGWRKAGKKLIGSCVGIVRNNGMEPRLQKELTEHGLPDNYEDILSDESTDRCDEMMTDVVEPVSAQYNEEWNPDSQNAWDSYASEHHIGPSFVYQVYFEKFRQNLFNMTSC